LEHARNLVERDILLRQILFQILKALDILLHLFPLRIGHETKPVSAAQDQLAGGVIDYLAGNRVELEFGDKPFDHHRVERKEVKKQRSICRRRERNKIAAVQRINPLMNVT